MKKAFHYQAVCHTVPGDLHTPVSTYLRVRDLFPQSVLMESSDYHKGEDGRSFIGLLPIANIAIGHGQSTATYPDGSVVTRSVGDDCPAHKAVSDFIADFRVEGEYAHYCGLYGYTSSNAIRYFEPVRVKDTTERKNDAPDLLYILYKYLIVFNDFRNEMMLLEMCADGEKPDLDRLKKAIDCPAAEVSYRFRRIGETRSTLTDDEHRENIRRGIRHCLRGDVFQIVLSRRFIQNYEGDDFQLYRALRSINPSPYLFYFDFGGFRIFGSSPETHFKVESGGKASIDPIAGTTRRSGDKAQDEELTRRLLADPKENAEHVMLVDLARNDLSRNCHGVQVDFFREPQYYSHVIHLVSRVSGRLDPGADIVKAFADTFPAGTLSGAPKVRALQLINEYEPHNRGAYGGCIGFIGLNGTLNQAITIRTFVSRNGELWFQAGGGIVAKSNVEKELQEVNNKLGALKKAILMAEQL